jgi:hypothetical protein
VFEILPSKQRNGNCLQSSAYRNECKWWTYFFGVLGSLVRCGKNTFCVLYLQWDCYKFVARIRLVNTENASVYVTVNCKVCRSAIALQLPVVPSGVYKWSVNPIIQSKPRLIITSHKIVTIIMIMWTRGTRVLTLQFHCVDHTRSEPGAIAHREIGWARKRWLQERNCWGQRYRI